MWYVVYISVLVFLAFLIPVLSFYYESDEDKSFVIIPLNQSIIHFYNQSISLFLKAHTSLHNNRYGVCDATSYGCVLNAVLFILFDCLPSSKNHNLLTQWQWNIFSYAIIRRYYLRYIFHNKHSSHIGCNSYIHCFSVCINHG